MQRYSKQREEVLSVLKNTISHPNAEWIYSEVRKTIPNISLGTVYRNLKELSEIGLITEITTSSNERNYDGDTSNHAHFVCTSCYKITDVFEYEDAKFHSSDYEITKTNTVFYGICPKCKKIN